MKTSCSHSSRLAASDAVAVLTLAEPAVYVIFGATGGIGSDLAKRLLAANSTVILAADQKDKLSKLKEELGGGETKTVDVLNSKQVCGF